MAAIEDKELAIWFPTLATAPTKIIRKELGQWVDDTDNEEKLTTWSKLAGEATAIYIVLSIKMKPRGGSITNNNNDCNQAE